MFAQILGDFSGIFNVALDTQRKRLDSLNQQEAIEG